jgi:hypothetical protein
MHMLQSDLVTKSRHISFSSLSGGDLSFTITGMVLRKDSGEYDLFFCWHSQNNDSIEMVCLHHLWAMRHRQRHALAPAITRALHLLSHELIVFFHRF